MYVHVSIDLNAYYMYLYMCSCRAIKIIASLAENVF